MALVGTDRQIWCVLAAIRATEFGARFLPWSPRRDVQTELDNFIDSCLEPDEDVTFVAESVVHYPVWFWSGSAYAEDIIITDRRVLFIRLDASGPRSLEDAYEREAVRLVDSWEQVNRPDHLIVSLTVPEGRYLMSCRQAHVLGEELMWSLPS
jgi:hypothetical protein